MKDYSSMFFVAGKRKFRIKSALRKPLLRFALWLDPQFRESSVRQGKDGYFSCSVPTARCPEFMRPEHVSVRKIHAAAFDGDTLVTAEIGE